MVRTESMQQGREEENLRCTHGEDEILHEEAFMTIDYLQSLFLCLKRMRQVDPYDLEESKPKFSNSFQNIRCSL